jgi:hypothetical protein
MVTIDLAGHVGTGMKWHGHHVRQGTVVYLVAEGARGIRKRVRAWEKHYGLEDGPTSSSCPARSRRWAPSGTPSSRRCAACGPATHRHRHPGPRSPSASRRTLRRNSASSSTASSSSAARDRRVRPRHPPHRARRRARPRLLLRQGRPPVRAPRVEEGRQRQANIVVTLKSRQAEGRRGGRRPPVRAEGRHPRRRSSSPTAGRSPRWCWSPSTLRPADGGQGKPGVARHGPPTRRTCRSKWGSPRVHQVVRGVRHPDAQGQDRRGRPHAQAPKDSFDEAQIDGG